MVASITRQYGVVMMELVLRLEESVNWTLTIVPGHMRGDSVEGPRRENVAEVKRFHQQC